LIFAIYKIISGYDCLMRLKRGGEVMLNIAIDPDRSVAGHLGR
jgi:hypothetical protein